MGTARFSRDPNFFSLPTPPNAGRPNQKYSVNPQLMRSIILLALPVP
jgi:hypothetical protein